MKTIERAHKPNQLWERVKLPRNYEKALEIIDKHLEYWPKLLVHKIKQRLTKMTQMRIRMRKLALKTREKIMTTPRKQIKRDARREEKSIEKELLERLKKGMYPDICNIVPDYDKILDKLQKEQEDQEEEEEHETEFVEADYDPEDEPDMEDFGLGTDEAYDEDNVGDDEDDDNDAEELKREEQKRRQRRESLLAMKKLAKDELGDKMKNKKARVLVEVENEEASERQKAIH